jgi:6-phosphofructokinase
VFDIDRFLADVKATYERHGRCVIAVSEGIHDASGQPILAQLAKDLERDAHGNVQLSGSGALADLLCEEIKAKLKIKRVRGDTFGYLQRSFVGCVSDVDQREAREVGEKAVQYAFWGDATARWPSSAPASIRPTTSCCRWKRWPARHARWKTNSSAPAAPT